MATREVVVVRREEKYEAIFDGRGAAEWLDGMRLDECLRLIESRELRGENEAQAL